MHANAWIYSLRICIDANAERACGLRFPFQLPDAPLGNQNSDTLGWKRRRCQRRRRTPARLHAAARRMTGGGAHGIRKQQTEERRWGAARASGSERPVPLCVFWLADERLGYSGSMKSSQPANVDPALGQDAVCQGSNQRLLGKRLICKRLKQELVGLQPQASASETAGGENSRANPFTRLTNANKRPLFLRPAPFHQVT